MKIIIKCPFCNRQIQKKFKKHLLTHDENFTDNVNKNDYFEFVVDSYNGGWLFLKINKIANIENFTKELSEFVDIISENKTSKITLTKSEIKKIRNLRKGNLKSEKIKFKEVVELQNNNLINKIIKNTKSESRNKERELNGESNSIKPIYHRNG